MEDGPALFGTWIVIVQIASKCSPRGTLSRDDGSPHTSQSLARMSRVPAGLIDRAFDVLESIKWLISEPYEYPAPGCDNLALGCASRARAQGMEGNGREGMEGNSVGARAQHFPEIPTLEQAIARTAAVGIPEGFIRIVYSKWAERQGKDGAGVVVEWLAHVTGRWTREQVQWKNGSHNGAQSSNRSLTVSAGQQIKILEEFIRDHPANSESVYRRKCSDKEVADYKEKRKKLRELKESAVA